MTWNHAFTVAFEVPASNFERWELCLEHEKELVIRCLEARLQELRDNDDEFLVALDGFGTYEEVN